MDKTFEKWCERLLDTGKRNRLINYKDTKLRTIDILLPEIDTIFNMISDEKSLEFFDVDHYIENFDNNEYDENEIKSSVPKVPKQQVVADLEKKVRDNQILAYKNGFTLKKILTSIKKISAISLSEKGINILYLALGFITWKDKDYSNNTFKSPLVLIPVKIENISPKLPFHLSQYDDEISTNPTLVYKFKNDFGLDLPCFREDGHSEESMSEYLSRIGEFAYEHDWSINSDVSIGTFSFIKLNMYKDLKENEKKMLSNHIICKIINSKQQMDERSIEDFDIDAYFKRGDEINLHNVVDADSSQLEAIYKAKKGFSFVLQGPPGTGKSQTITNLIAEFLYDGKKVLFVSEKLAALNVVFNNLKKAGLSDFCLELHSNKTNKKDFIEELNRVLQIDKRNVNNSAKQEIEELLTAKTNLDNYAKILYEIQPIIERTPFQLLGAIAKYQQYPKFEYPIKNLKEKDINYLKKAVTELQVFAKFKDTVGYDYHKNIWYGYKNIGTSYESKINLRKTLNGSYDYILKLEKISKELNDLFEDSISLKSCNSFYENLRYFETIGALKTFDGNYFNYKYLLDIVSRIQRFNKDKKDLEYNNNLISGMFDKELFDLDVKKYYLRFKNDYISGFGRFFSSNYKRDKRIISQYLLDKTKKIKYKDIVTALHAVKTIQELEKNLFDEEDGLFNAFKSARDYTRNYKWEEIESDVINLSRVLTDNNDLLYSITEKQFYIFQHRLNSIIKEYKEIDNNKEFLIELQSYFDERIKHLDDIDFSELRLRLQECIEDLDNIDNWIRCQESLNALKKLDLLEFVDESIKNNIPRETLVETYKYLFYNQWMFEVLSKNRVLHNFSRELQDDYVNKFKEKDKLKFNIAKAEINHKITSNMPKVWQGSSNGQVSILIREGHKKRKQKAVRILMKEICELIQQLKPCFLMSPLSVSTYLDFEKCKFDVVIFDEASQIFPWDAVGAIARAKQVIVVGDSKQMPPTNFFTSGIIDDDIEEDDDYDDSMDFESILDLCMASFGKIQSLNWHYRSKTEDLILFSNKNFYNGKLITFPSVHKDKDNMGVNFYYVENGIFDRRSKCNLIEAEKVVDLIYEHFRTEPRRSLGVVAFSVSQQDAIEEIIRKRREKDDSFAEYFSDNKPEPFFVKNLETVQGDERDTIIFSIAYAKGSDGRFLHNFGPLNKKGGERRLNVAITRAKYNVKLVSSIKSYDIDLNNTKAEGVRLLKEYLDCAEHGMQNIQKDLLVDPNAEPDSDFEIDVYNVIKNAGYNVDMQVGCSGYRIDLGIRHPLKNDYVLAVECDGATYHSGKTTRDRDRLRQEVLENLGWKFYRIWSTDWFKNRDIEIKRLLSAIEKAINRFDAENHLDQDKLTTSNNEDQPIEIVRENFINVIKEEKPELKTLFPLYEKYDIYSKSMPSFNNTIHALIQQEGPITEELLLSETAVFFGREKVTSVVREGFNFAIKKIKDIYKIDNYYVSDPNMKIQMRIPKDGDKPREISMIANVELESGLYTIIKNNIGITKNDLLQTTTSLLGYNRMGNNIQSKLEQSISNLLRSRKIKEVNQQYFINEQSNTWQTIEADDLGW